MVRFLGRRMVPFSGPQSGCKNQNNYRRAEPKSFVCLPNRAKHFRQPSPLALRAGSEKSAAFFPRQPCCHARPVEQCFCPRIQNDGSHTRHSPALSAVRVHVIVPLGRLLCTCQLVAMLRLRCDTSLVRLLCGLGRLCLRPAVKLTAWRSTRQLVSLLRLLCNTCLLRLHCGLEPFCLRPAVKLSPWRAFRSHDASATAPNYHWPARSPPATLSPPQGEHPSSAPPPSLPPPPPLPLPRS